MLMGVPSLSVKISLMLFENVFFVCFVLVLIEMFFMCDIKLFFVELLCSVLLILSLSLLCF